MSINHFCLFFILLVFSAGCATVSINYDYDPDVTFSDYKTFNWMPHPNLTKRQALVLNRVKTAVKRELRSKG